MLGGLAIGFAHLTKPTPAARGVPIDAPARRRHRRRLARVRA